MKVLDLVPIEVRCFLAFERTLTIYEVAVTCAITGAVGRRYWLLGRPSDRRRIAQRYFQ